MMAQRHRLGCLQVGEAGHDVACVLLRARNQRDLDRGQPCVDLLDRLARPQFEIGRHLIVAASCGVQAARDRADQFGQPRFHCHVDVFQIPVLGHAITLVLGGDGLEAVVDGLRILTTQDTLRGQHAHMRAAARDILPPQRLVEGNRGIDFAHDGTRPVGEAAAPHRVAAPCAGVVRVPICHFACARPRLDPERVR